MAGEYDSKASEVLVGNFRTILDELEREESPPVFIVSEGEGYAPNAHFSVRIDGDSLAGADVRALELNTLPSPALSDTASSSSKDQASSSRPPQTTQTGTMVQLPPQRGSDSANKKATIG